MASRKLDPQAVEAEVAAVGGLDLAAIRERWRVFFGNPPPKTLRHAFLVKACAYAIRTKAFGDLSAATRRRLRSIAEASREGKPTPAAPVRTKAGTRLIRAWGGRTHVVSVLPDGRFEYDGKTYRSLSAIAGVITGTNWNGKTFFGVKQTSPGRAVGAGKVDRSAGKAGQYRSPCTDEMSPAAPNECAGSSMSPSPYPSVEPDSQLEMFGHG